MQVAAATARTLRPTQRGLTDEPTTTLHTQARKHARTTPTTPTAAAKPATSRAALRCPPPASFPAMCSPTLLLPGAPLDAPCGSPLCDDVVLLGRLATDTCDAISHAEHTPHTQHTHRHAPTHNTARTAAAAATIAAPPLHQHCRAPQALPSRQAHHRCVSTPPSALAQLLRHPTPLCLCLCPVRRPSTDVQPAAQRRRRRGAVSAWQSNRGGVVMAVCMALLVVRGQREVACVSQC